MIKSPYIIFYNHSENANLFNDIELKEENILFFHAVTKQFLKKSELETLSIEPLIDYNIPKLWLKEDSSSRMIKVWENTPDEIEYISLGENGAKLIDKNILNLDSFTLSQSQKDKISKSNFTKNIDGYLNEYELTSVEIYPNLNERLLLCKKFNKNVDPAKDILFNEKLPLEYKTYVKIVSGKFPLADLGY
ncbi:hypothetical protein ULMS_16670 [Patiriisocius marinistellae]|uniref:Uncharacterized protein n=2 Tax=Patiriisocius marinistellae TaxID=2494560 RepID=A0A5J4G0U6_9FLAO|nr:hypothetical protein ULMS_16670 [Patiriisocius marinistellae]